MSYTQDRDHTVVVLTGAGFSLAEIRELFRLAAAAEHHNEAICCREVTAREEKRAERADERAEEIAARHNCKLRVSGDPRGYAISIILPGKCPPYNSWGGAECGWGIPTRSR